LLWKFSNACHLLVKQLITEAHFRFYKALILTDPITSAYKRVEIGDGVLISSGDDEATDEFYVARVDAMFDNGENAEALNC